MTEEFVHYPGDGCAPAHPPNMAPTPMPDVPTPIAEEPTRFVIRDDLELSPTALQAADDLRPNDRARVGMAQSGPQPAPEAPKAHDPEDDWQDLEAPRAGRSVAEEMTLTIAKGARHGYLSTPAARWLVEQCHPIDPRIRIRHNVKTGEVALVPSIVPELGFKPTAQGNKDGLPRRMYVVTLSRLGLVKEQQVVKLAAKDGRLILRGIKRVTG